MSILAAMTVLGPIAEDSIGITLPHEHVLLDTTSWWVKPQDPSKEAIVDKPVSIEILGDIRRDIFVNKDNMKLNSPELAVDELRDYRHVGGNTLVDVTSIGLDRQIGAVQDVSKRSGVNIICATGWYLDNTHPDYVKRKTAEELAEIMVREITIGIENSNAKAGVIGEIGCDDPLTENEKKVLKASGMAQSETGAPLTMHVGCWNYVEKRREIKKADQYLEIIQAGGGDLRKVYLSHMDVTCHDIKYHSRIIDTYDVVLDYDNFGWEYFSDSFYPGAYEGLSDGDRVRGIAQLVKSGYEKHLMLSNDVCTKTQLRRFGGYGYSHIVRDILPSLKYLGLSEKQIRTMVVETPKRIFSF